MRRALAIMVVWITSGCAGRAAGAARTAGAGCEASDGYATSSVITAEELRRTRASNLYDAIRRLRPNYFLTRGPSTIYNQPEAAFVVIVNRHAIGGLQELHDIATDQFVCVRRLTAAEVLMITGVLAPDGGIELVYGS